MESDVAIIVYLLSFRLAVILSGVVTIYLGYKLFFLGVYGNNHQKNDEISASVGEAKFKLVNVAPGSTFALFGASLIMVMLLKAPPQVTINSDGADYRGGSSSITLKQTSNNCWQDGLDQRETEYIVSCWQKVAATLNDQAWDLYENNADRELSLQLVRLAIAASPEDEHIAEFRDTLSKLEDKGANKRD